MNTNYFIITFSMLCMVACATPRPPVEIPDRLPAEAAIIAQPRVAIALGGGGARGMAHVGVLKVLEREGIPIDLIVGTSAGSIVGALYADNPNAAGLEQLLMKTSTKELLHINVFDALQGPVDGYKLEYFIFTHTGARNFSELKIKLVAVCTNLQTGKVFPIASGPIAPAVHASSALPPVFHPVQIYGELLVDGGVIDCVPTDIARRYHPKLVLSVNIEQGLDKKMPKNIFGVFLRGLRITVGELGKLQADNADISMHPDVGASATFSSSQAEKIHLVKAGEAAAEKVLPAIRRAMKERGIKRLSH